MNVKSVSLKKIKQPMAMTHQIHIQFTVPFEIYIVGNMVKTTIKMNKELLTLINEPTTVKKTAEFHVMVIIFQTCLEILRLNNVLLIQKRT